jgi:hypothetical protein
LATSRRITQTDTSWIVPSQSGKGKYTVDPTLKRCTCPDYELRRTKCKHIYAVEYSISKTTNDKGETTVTKTVKITYRQDWPAYNAAQTTEKAKFMHLLADLCHGIPEPVQTFGRPRIPLADMLFCAAFKVYTTVSTRRCMSDLKDAHAKGYISKVPHYNSICNYLETPALMPLLYDLIVQSSLPLKAIERDFAVDSTGFTTSNNVSWYNVRYGHEQDNHEWIKLHLMCGVKTNIVTSVEISGGFVHDSPLFPPLVQATARNFTMKQVSADKVYSSRDNLERVAQHGGTPYIPFKRDAKDQNDGSIIWNKLWHFYHYQREKFLTHYHKRSNVESTVWMIKAKFGTRIRSKTEVPLSMSYYVKFYVIISVS